MNGLKGIIAAAMVMMAAQPAYAQNSYYARSRLLATTTPVQGTWFEGSWSSWNSTCSDTATRTKTVECSGTKPEASESTGIYTGCGNFIRNGDFTQGAQTWSGLTTAVKFAGLGTSGLIAPGSSATTISYPLEYLKIYTLSAACENANGQLSKCSLKVSVISNGQTMLSSLYSTAAPITTVRSFGQFQTYGGPTTLTIENTGTVGMYVDSISIK